MPQPCSKLGRMFGRTVRGNLDADYYSLVGVKSSASCLRQYDTLLFIAPFSWLPSDVWPSFDELVVLFEL